MTIVDVLSHRTPPTKTALQDKYFIPSQFTAFPIEESHETSDSTISRLNRALINWEIHIPFLFPTICSHISLSIWVNIFTIFESSLTPIVCLNPDLYHVPVSQFSSTEPLFYRCIRALCINPF